MEDLVGIPQGHEVVYSRSNRSIETSLALTNLFTIAFSNVLNMIRTCHHSTNLTTTTTLTEPPLPQAPSSTTPSEESVSASSWRRSSPPSTSSASSASSAWPASRVKSSERGRASRQRLKRLSRLLKTKRGVFFTLNIKHGGGQLPHDGKAAEFTSGWSNVRPNGARLEN